ncbi:MAG: hypothetical protein EPO09_13490 [Aquabacterium sp.]|uniref:hypothetical protein n=1 Tax=Aquabacterium sp. TaxID=1872578 RepID=UPI001225A4F7|nr:hypothetical protein [Aquabacterium sp.]TAK93189.1 MAG: hypothetical protein EPO09_13490 [Aquabacterium sp.]
MKFKAGGVGAVAITLLGMTLLWVAMKDGQAKTEAARAHSQAPRAMASYGAPVDALAGADPAELSAAASRHRLLASQLTEARQRLNSYRAATVYPPQSQPIAAHADVLQPFAPVVEDRAALSAQGVPLSGRHLITSQDRVYVSGTDSVLLTVAMRDDQNRAAPLRVIRAVAHEVQDVSHTQTVMPVAVSFDDRGSQGDAAAGDGVFSARLQPATQNFAATQGTIRVDIDLQSDIGGPVHAFFDIVYMPQVPAVWSGPVRESMDNGSLDFHLKAEMHEAGRYIVTARAYDATGKPFALLSFNDEVPAGTNDIRLSLFGKLVRDAKPVFPITLRDIDGYILYESRFPDRAMMPRWPQTAYTSRPHSLSEFADTEWTSEQRQRYLTEFGKDVQVAEQNLRDASKPAQP